MRRMVFALLEHLTDPLLADSIAGDLEEEGHRRAKRSPAAALVWFWRELVAIVVRACAFRARDAITFRRPMKLLPGVPDFRHGVRVLRNKPWYSLTAIGVIALTMTLATTVFAVVEDVLFHRLPFERSHELYHVGFQWSDDALARTDGRLSVSRDGVPLSLLDVRDLAQAVPEISIAAYTTIPGRHTAGSIGPWRPIVAKVAPRFLEVLGVQPFTGGFDPADFELPPGAPVPALVTHEVWQAQFGGRPDIVGADYAPDGQASERYRIAGVLPRGFVYPADAVVPDFLTPLVPSTAETRNRRMRVYAGVARLPPGHTDASYRDRFDAVAGAAALDSPDRGMNGGAGPAGRALLLPLSDWLGYRPRWMAKQVLAAALVLVLLGCVNVSGLVAARSVDRSRELALRRALGASARDIIALVVAETALIVALGALLALALAAPMTTLVVRVMPPGIAPAEVPSLDWRVLAFALLVSVVSIAAVCVWPLARSLRRDARAALAEGGQLITPARSRGRLMAVGLQVAMGLTLTVCGAFVVRSLTHAMETDPGFSSGHLVVLEGHYPPAMRDLHSVAARAPRLLLLRRTTATDLDDLLARVRAQPGVVAAGATHATILKREGAGSGYGDNYAITEGFVDALQPRLAAGRWPTPAEISRAASVAVISESVARRIAPGASPIGQTIRNYAGGSGTLEVIGVAEGARYRAWDSPSHETDLVFAPYRATAFDPRFTIAVRVTDPRGVLAWARREAREPEGPLRLTSAALADDLVVETVRARQFQSWVFGTFSMASLAVAGVGILGLAAMTTISRRREIGVRLTLGATRRRIVLQLLGEQVLAVSGGIVVGVFAGLASGAVLYGSYVYGVEPWDPRVWVTAIGTVLVTATVGMLIPARRASRVDPVAALRCE